jgi:predicted AAA+ superfamily ATPase
MRSDIVFKRYLKIDLPKRQSAFLWGARKTGKSSYLQVHFPESVSYQLLKSDVFIRFAKEPYLLREEILALPEEKLRYPIIIDEVQKIPPLLDEIHWLIENTKAQFILCGSSARKLKNEAANLLGGRAWRYTFYPLIYPEIPNFDLLRALNTGLVPSHYLSPNPKKSLKAYILDYLVEEIQKEGLTRNLPAFARFLDSVPYGHGSLINYVNIARECAVDSKTVKEYYQILVDTLVGYYIYPYKIKKGREVIVDTPKFYLFDVGVFNALAKQTIPMLKGTQAGSAFEHYILMELMAYRGLNDLDFDIQFWRTKTGFEVDFILAEGSIAIEVKISENPSKTELKGLIAFSEEHKPKKALVVCLVPRARKVILESGEEILIWPWKMFLDKLWNQEII